MWSYQKINLDLKFLFKISRNSSQQKTNFIISFTQNSISGCGECAPNTRYGESIEATELQIQHFVHQKCNFETIESINIFLKQAPYFQSVKNALETAFYDWYAKNMKSTVARVLDLPQPSSKATMFTLPIMPVEDLSAFYNQFELQKYSRLKLKIDAKVGAELLGELNQLKNPNQRLCIDANEAFETLDSFLKFEKSIDHISLDFVEQPFPATNVVDYVNLKKQTHHKIFADESIVNTIDLEQIKQQFHGVNVKMMKTGGYAVAKQILTQAKQQGLETMIGCMVETSLGISHALNLASLADYLDLDSFLYVINEPYRLVNCDSEGNIFK